MSLVVIRTRVNGYRHFAWSHDGKTVARIMPRALALRFIARGQLRKSHDNGRIVYRVVKIPKAAKVAA